MRSIPRLAPVFLAAAALGSAPLPPADSVQADARIQQLWQSRIVPMLQKSPWKDGSSYEAGHELMVPLHAAFLLGNKEWEAEFAEHFTRFSESDPGTIVANFINREQYMILASRFLVLAQETGHAPMIPPKLADLILSQITSIWTRETAFLYPMKPFPSLKARLDWKLSNPEPPKGFKNCLIFVDDDYYTCALAADLAHYYRLANKPVPPIVSQILGYGLRMYRQAMVPLPNGGLTIQPGVWTDHPDFVYAGNTSVKPGLAKRMVNDISWDSSHAHRFPVWLMSMEGGWPDGSAEAAYFRGLQSKLEVQFMTSILVPPTPDFPGYRTNNFINGWNGVYRYGYQSVGKDRGWGPYQLSNTLFKGWWVFLGTDRVLQVYQRMAQSLPFPPQAAKAYAPLSVSATMAIPGSTVQDWDIDIRLAARMPIDKLK